MRLDNAKIKTSLLAIPSTCLICFFSGSFIPQALLTNRPIELLYLVSIGGYMRLDSGFYGYMLYAILMSVTFLIRIVLFSAILIDDFGRASIFIFTRLGSRTGWFNNKMKEIFMYMSIYSILEIISVALYGVIFRYDFSFFDRRFLFITVFSILLSFITQFFYVLLSNILALKLSTLYAFIICWIAYVPILLILMPYRCSWVGLLMVVLPSAQSISSIHSNMVPELVQQGSIPKFTQFYSLIYLIAIIAVIYIWGKRVVSKKNLF